jgi:hypothetical protein
MAVRDIGVLVVVLLKHLLQSAVASALVNTMCDFDDIGRPETVFTDKQIQSRS